LNSPPPSFSFITLPCIPGIVSTGFIFPFTRIYTHYLNHNFLKSKYISFQGKWIELVINEAFQICHGFLNYCYYCVFYCYKIYWLWKLHRKFVVWIALIFYNFWLILNYITRFYVRKILYFQ
jgi:hypothetical protein